MVAQLVAAIVGAWLMAAPDVLDYGGALALSDHVVGPLVVTCGLVAAWQATRAVRWANTLFGAWIVVAALVLAPDARTMLAGAAAGFVVLGCSLVRGRTRHPIGGGWAALGRAPRSLA